MPIDNDVRDRATLIVVIAVGTLIDTVLASMGGAGAAPVTPPAPPPPVPRPSVVPDRRPPVVVAVDTAEPLVGLSFDDGPDPRWTPALLDALAASGARATFFVTGTQVRENPELVRRMVAEGHEVANHSDTHPRLDRSTAQAAAAEIAGAAHAIAGAGVPRTPWFRAPRGQYDEETVAVAAAAGLQEVGWTVCLERWLRRLGPAAGLDETAARVGPGAIIVAHDGGIPDRSATVAAVPELLRRLTADGYRMVTVTELLRAGPPLLGRPGYVASARQAWPVLPYR